MPIPDPSDHLPFFRLAAAVVEVNTKVAVGRQTLQTKRTKERERADALAWLRTPERSKWWFEAAGVDYATIRDAVERHEAQEGGGA